MKRALTAIALALALITPARAANDLIYLECGGVLRGSLTQQGISKLVMTLDLDNRVMTEGPFKLRITNITQTTVSFEGSGIVGYIDRVSLSGEQHDGTQTMELRRCNRTMPQF